MCDQKNMLGRAAMLYVKFQIWVFVLIMFIAFITTLLGGK